MTITNKNYENNDFIIVVILWLLNNIHLHYM